MFSKTVYTERRNKLRKLVGEGVLIFPGSSEVPYNYPSNTYPFRQDSNFLYFFGIDRPGLTGIIDAGNNSDLIIGDDYKPETIIWQGRQPSIKELAHQAGINAVLSYTDFAKTKTKLFNKKKLHWLPAYRMHTMQLLETLLNEKPDVLRKNASAELIRAVVKLRSVKSADEINSIQKITDVYAYCLKLAKNYITDGMNEQVVAGQLEGFIRAHGAVLPFTPICSVRGEILHNPNYSNKFKKGQLLLIDAGAESKKNNYCCDITRVYPVSGKFTAAQKDIYETVLKANKEAIRAIKPGVLFKDLHRKAAAVRTEGLKEMGLIKGNTADAVREGAHTLFFPHGLGHMMGLDVHDMEGLGEEFVGYDEKTKRSDKQGLSHLRFARELKEGFVLTIEPGIYFNPDLIKQWKAEKKCTSFIQYSKLDPFLTFGGIRIEDNIAVTKSSCINFSKNIHKEVKEIEKQK